jgi:hypothetical protein
LALALLFSLLIHALLLSLTFGIEEFGFPGLVAPWQKRRIEAPALRVLLAPAHVKPADPAVKPVAGPSQRAPIEPPGADGPAPTPTVLPTLRPRGRAVANAPRQTDDAGRSEANTVARVAPAK